MTSVTPHETRGASSKRLAQESRQLSFAECAMHMPPTTGKRRVWVMMLVIKYNCEPMKHSHKLSTLVSFNITCRTQRDMSLALCELGGDAVCIGRGRWMGV